MSSVDSASVADASDADVVPAVASQTSSGFGHRDEKALNHAIATAIGRCHPRAVVEAERSGSLVGSAKQPDIVVTASGRERVLVENKYAGVPARELEKQCATHFGSLWASDQRPVRVVVGKW